MRAGIGARPFAPFCATTLLCDHHHDHQDNVLWGDNLRRPKLRWNWKRHNDNNEHNTILMIMMAMVVKKKTTFWENQQEKGKWHWWRERTSIFMFMDNCKRVMCSFIPHIIIIPRARYKTECASMSILPFLSAASPFSADNCYLLKKEKGQRMHGTFSSRRKWKWSGRTWESSWKLRN